MSTYHSLLLKNESLNDLCERIKSESDLENLIQDLAKGNVYHLVANNYLFSDRFTDPQEEAIKWLMHIPMCIRKFVPQILYKLIRESIESNDWGLLDVLLAAINSNNYSIPDGLAENCIYQKEIPELVEIKLYLTLINIDLKNSTSILDIDKWERKIEISRKPHLATVLMSLCKSSFPVKSFSYLKLADKYMQELPAMPEVRHIFQNLLMISVINYFDIYNKTHVEFLKLLEDFEKFCEELISEWTHDLVYDVLTLSKLSKIRERIELADTNFINNKILGKRIAAKGLDDYADTVLPNLINTYRDTYKFNLLDAMVKNQVEQLTEYYN